jgi:hypothetical protein
MFLLLDTVTKELKKIYNIRFLLTIRNFELPSPPLRRYRVEQKLFTLKYNNLQIKQTTPRIFRKIQFKN